MDRHEKEQALSEDYNTSMKKRIKRFEMRCVECGENEKLFMLPHRDKNGNMVGVLFACDACRDIVQGSECIIDARRDEEIAVLKARIENLEHAYCGIFDKWEALKAEIERKDAVLRHIQSFCGDEMIGETDILERIENLNLPEKPDSSQVLSEEE